MEERKEKYAGESEIMQFEESYKEFLDALKSMPRGTKEEKESRYRWVRNHEKYDAFIVDVVRLCKPAYFEKLSKYLGDARAYDTLAPESGMATMKRREIDPLALMEAVASAVGDYTGENQKGEPYSLPQSVGIKYSQISQRMAGTYDTGLLGTDVTEKNACHVLKLTRKVKESLEHSKGELSLKEAIEKCTTVFKHKFTKKELDEAVMRVNGLDMIGHLDQPAWQEDEEAGTSREIADGENGIEKWENDAETRMFWEKFTENFLSKWKKVEAAANGANRELLKHFLSKDLLLLLKLYPLSDVERVQIKKQYKMQYKDFLEPKCGQWCYRRENCPLDAPSGLDVVLQEGRPARKKNVSHEGCYVRYGCIPKDNRTGDEEIYSYLKACKGSLYETIFDNTYIQFAYQGGVESLDDMHVKMLKSHKAEDAEDKFEFTDAVMGYATKIKKDKLSKCRKYYENIAKRQLYQLFISGN